MAAPITREYPGGARRRVSDLQEDAALELSRPVWTALHSGSLPPLAATGSRYPARSSTAPERLARN